MQNSFSQVVDYADLQSLLDSFCKTRGINSAVFDPQGSKLAGTEYNKLCDQFHTKSPEALCCCMRAGHALAKEMSTDGENSITICPNGLVDIKVPLMINSSHCGDLFVGQILLEKPDIDFFRRQAQKYGFDERTYLEALSDIPILSKTQVNSYVEYLFSLSKHLVALCAQKTQYRELIKELGCLYAIVEIIETPDISLEDIFQKTAQRLCPAWQYPEIARSRIKFKEHEYTSEKFCESPFRQMADIIVNGRTAGSVEMFYLEERPEKDEGPFLKEERRLLNAVAERLGRVAERIQGAVRTQHLNRVLRGIRNVNQLITTENDPKRLIERACINLTETLGYNNAWIALTENKSGAVKMTASAGFDEGFAVMRAGGRTYGILSVSVSKAYANDTEEQDLFSEVAGDLSFALYKIEQEGITHYLNEIVSTSPQPMTFVSSDYRFLAVNKAYSEHCGKSPGQILGHTLADIFGQNVFETKIKPRLERCLAGETISYDAQIDHPERGARWMHMQHFPYFDMQGNLTGLVSHAVDITERIQTNEALKRVEWMLSKGNLVTNVGSYVPFYGDVTDLNTYRLILDAVEKDTLGYVATDIMDFLDTSLAVYEKNGDYAYGMFVSGWCQFLDAASRRLCGTDDNREALNCGKWLCHENCWNDSAKAAIALGEPTDIECVGGIRLYAVPIRAGNEIVGAVNIGYGNPPTDMETLKNLSDMFHVSIEELKQQAEAYKIRPEFIIEMSKHRLHSAADLIGEIIERKRSEEALRYERNMFKNLMDASPAGITLVDAAGRIYYANRRAEQLLGLAKSTIIGRMYNDAEWTITDFSGNSYPEENLPFCIVQRTGEPVYDVRHALKNSDGRSILLSINAVPIFNSSGNFEGMISTINDITERIKTQTKLEKSEEKYRLVSENIPVVVYSALPDESSTTTFVSENVRDLTGHSADDLLTHPDLWLTLIHPDDKNLFFKTLNEHRKRKSVFLSEYQIITTDGQAKWVRDKAKPTFNEKGEIVRIDGFIEDITDQKKIEEQLQQSQKMEAIGTLAGGIAHDFNNILAGIIGYVEVVKDEIVRGLPVDGYLDDILQLGERAKDLTQQILTFSRKTVQKSGPLQLQPILKECLKMLRATIPTTIDLLQNIQPHCRAVIANPAQIHQLIMNLCTNAADEMMDTGGVLEVTLDETQISGKNCSYDCTIKPGKYVLLQVRDTGKGIPEENLKRIFEPFFTTKEKGKGTGLGLAVVYGIIRSHDGAITVNSIPGEGTTFTVLLPAADVASELIQEETDKGEPPTGTEHILFVDDETAMVDVAHYLLSHQGYKVTAVQSAYQALALFKDDPGAYDIVITDQTMPKMTGFQLAKELINIRPDIPVILCTGYSETVYEEEAKKAGIKEFMTKPLSRKVIASAIRKVLDNKHATPE